MVTCDISEANKLVPFEMLYNIYIVKQLQSMTSLESVFLYIVQLFLKQKFRASKEEEVK